MGAAAVAAGLAIGGRIYSAISGNQRKQRNKGYIGESYRTAKQGLQVRQQNIRQGTTESLIARGLTQGGVTPIQRAMAGGAAGEHRDYTEGLKGVDRLRNKAEVDLWNKQHEHLVHAAPDPSSAHTLGEQQQVDNDKQFQLEQTDLENQRNRAETENKADYLDTLVHAVTGVGSDVAQAYSVSQDKKMVDEGKAAATSPIKSTMLSGAADGRNWAFGVVGNDPLNAPGSSWNRGRTVTGTGLTNDLFHG